jgi:hypothetical protein
MVKPTKKGLSSPAALMPVIGAVCAKLRLTSPVLIPLISFDQTFLSKRKVWFKVSSHKTLRRWCTQILGNRFVPFCLDLTPIRKVSVKRTRHFRNYRQALKS